MDNQTKHNSLEKWFKEVESLKTLYVINLMNSKKKKQKLLKRTKIYEKRKIKNDKGFIVLGDDDLENSKQEQSR